MYSMDDLSKNCNEDDEMKKAILLSLEDSFRSTNGIYSTPQTRSNSSTFLDSGLSEDEQFKRALYVSAIEAGSDVPNDFDQFCSQVKPEKSEDAANLSFESWKNRPISERICEAKGGTGQLAESKDYSSSFDSLSYSSSSSTSLNGYPPVSGISHIPEPTFKNDIGIFNSTASGAAAFFPQIRPPSAAPAPSVLTSSSHNLFDIYKPASSSNHFNSYPSSSIINSSLNHLNSPGYSPADLLNNSDAFSPTDSTPSILFNGSISSPSHGFDSTKSKSVSSNSSQPDIGHDEDETLRLVLELSKKETKLDAEEQKRIEAEEFEAQTKFVLEESKLLDMTDKLRQDLKMETRSENNSYNYNKENLTAIEQRTLEGKLAQEAKFRELDFQPYDLIPDIDDDWEDPSKEDWQPAGGRRVRRVSLTSWKPAVLSIGSTNSQSMYNPEEFVAVPGEKRLVVIDGSNVGYDHGLHKTFSLHGVCICIEYFTKMGHEVVSFLPPSRYNFSSAEEKETLDVMINSKLLVITPQRKLPCGRIVSSYDDLFIIKYAASKRGIIVSNDQYRDIKERGNPDYTEQVENRVLPFKWLGDTFMVPDDPLGRDGPSLTQFLHH